MTIHRPKCDSQYPTEQIIGMMIRDPAGYHLICPNSIIWQLDFTRLDDCHVERYIDTFLVITGAAIASTLCNIFLVIDIPPKKKQDFPSKEREDSFAISSPSPLYTEVFEHAAANFASSLRLANFVSNFKLGARATLLPTLSQSYRRWLRV